MLRGFSEDAAAIELVFSEPHHDHSYQTKALIALTNPRPVRYLSVKN
jgi:hypothetical protein